MTKTVKTALAAVTLAAATLALPASASAADYRNNCSDTENAILGGVVGGSLGTVIGEGIAGRGDRTEGAVLGAIIGGIAGAAIGDGATDCEKRYDRNRVYTTQGQTTRHYPTRTQTRTVYTSPHVQTVGHPGRGHGHAHGRNRGNSSYGYNNRYNDPLYQIDRQIEDVRRRGDQLKREIRYSRHYNPRLERRLERNGRKLKELKRERRRIKKFTDRQRDRNSGYNRNQGYGYNDGYRRGHYHGNSRNLCYSDH
jgi:hypothetical protein